MQPLALNFPNLMFGFSVFSKKLQDRQDILSNHDGRCCDSSLRACSLFRSPWSSYQHKIALVISQCSRYFTNLYSFILASGLFSYLSCYSFHQKDVRVYFHKVHQIIIVCRSTPRTFPTGSLFLMK